MSSIDDRGDIPLHDEPSFDLEGEPTVLGASATVEDVKPKRKRQKVKRQATAASVDSDGAIEFVYEPHVAVVPPLRTYFSDLWDRRAFLVELARSDIRGARSNTTLGSLWALLDPLFMAAIYFFLFTVIRRGGGRGSDFVPLIVAGFLHFQITGGAITAGGKSIRGGKNLMLNSTFPRALLPLSTVYRLILTYLPSIPIILGAMLLFFGPADAFSVHQLWFFPVFSLQIIISTGLALLVATTVVFFADVTNLMSYVSRVMLFSSPIIYPVDALSTEIVDILRFQPLFGVFAAYQTMLSGEQPDLTMLGISALWAVVLLVGGFWVFLRYERRFASRL